MSTIWMGFTTEEMLVKVTMSVKRMVTSSKVSETRKVNSKYGLSSGSIYLERFPINTEGD